MDDTLDLLFENFSSSAEEDNRLVSNFEEECMEIPDEILSGEKEWLLTYDEMGKVVLRTVEKR